MNKIFIPVFIVFLLIYIMIVAFIRLFPFIDIPFHISVAAIIKYYGAAGNSFDLYYLIPSLLKSNIFHLLFLNLPFFDDVETANKIFYIIYIIIFPLSIFILIKIFKGNTWFTLLSFFYIFNLVCMWGFTGNTVSIPFFIINLAFCYKYFADKKNIYLVLIFLNLLLIFFCHFQTAIYSLLLFIIFIVMFYRKSLKFIFNSLAVVIPLVSLMVYIYLLDASENYENIFVYFFKYFKDGFLGSVVLKIQVFFVNEHFHWGEEPYGSVIGSAISILIMFPVLALLLKRKIKNSEKNNKKLILHTVIITSLVFFFLLPEDIPGQNIVSYRFSIYFFTAIIVLLSIQNFSNNFIKKYFSVAIILLFIFTGYTAEYFISFHNENREFNSDFYSDLKQNDRLGGLIYAPMYRGRPVYIHFNNYFTVWKSGISTGYVDYRYAILKRKVDENILPVAKEWISVFNNYNNEFSRLEYILVRDTLNREIQNFVKAKSSGKWMLYKNINLQENK
ncbi:MAG: hypothetical protein JW917_11175 [Ignavibacteria bacterium]|nr:hypothetical protein [Ignavibacteria bacterium]